MALNVGKVITELKLLTVVPRRLVVLDVTATSASLDLIFAMKFFRDIEAQNL